MKSDIKKQFGAIAKSYDLQRRILIPCFDEFYSCILSCVDDSEDNTNILDIGAGTGLLTAFLFDKYPKSNYTLIDIADEMIDQAKKRFIRQPNFTYITADYVNYNFEKKYNIIVSALSIHHLEDNEKAQLYKNIFNCLDENGIFVNGDQFLSRSPFVESLIQEKWRRKIRESNLPSEEVEAVYNRMKMDKPATVEQNIQWLEQAGFIEVDLMYKYFPFGVVRGKKI